MSLAFPFSIINIAHLTMQCKKIRFLSSYVFQTPQAIARAIARACTKVYADPSLTETAKKELLDETKGIYISPLPEGAVPGDGM